MANNITLTKITRESGAYVAGTTFETEQQAGGEHRPVVKVGESALPTGSATAAAQALLLTELEKKADLTETQPVSAATLPLPTGAATAANQTNGSQLSGILGFRSSDSTYQPLRLDKATNAIIVMDYEHHELHDGNHFIYYDYDADVDTAAPKYYRLTTPNTTKWVHMQFMLFSEGAGTWQLFENPTVNAAGTTAAVFNNNRNSSVTAGLTVAFDPTSTADGTQIKVWRTGSGTTAPMRAGSESRSSVELILKQNEDYFLKFTPDADNARTKVEMLWYEHQNVAQ